MGSKAYRREVRGERQGYIYQLMTYNKVIKQEIEYPIKYHITTSTGSIAEKLLWKIFTKRSIEKIDDFSNYLR